MSAKLPTGSVKMTAALGVCRRAGGIHKGSVPEEALNCLNCRDVSREHQREETGKGEPVNHTVKLGFITQAAIKKKKKKHNQIVWFRQYFKPKPKICSKEVQIWHTKPSNNFKRPCTNSLRGVK